MFITGFLVENLSRIAYPYFSPEELRWQIIIPIKKRLK